MGNKHGRSKSTSDVPAKRRKKPGGRQDANGHKDKHISCPDLGGATPYRLYDEEPKINYSIYRSYRDIDNNKVKDNNPVDFKVYRRSAGGYANSERPSTLPRGFGRSKSAFLPGREVTTPNGGVYMDWERGLARTPDSEYGTLRSGRSSRLSKRSSIASSCGTSSSKLTQVAASDFPPTDEIKRKLAYFEGHFARCLVQKYSLLPDSDQLASLALAMRKSFGQTQTIKLLDYMEGEHVPLDLLAPQESGTYVLCIPQALFHGIAHVRQDKNKDMKLWTSLASDIVMCVGIEAANELSRMYEYQIALMFDDASIRILANHAAECAVDYVRNNTYMDRNAAIQGVVKNIPPNPDGLPKYLAVILGEKEMKWELYEIFKQCGLRKELSLVSDELIIDLDEDSLDTDPWTYHFANGADPVTYGYRGQLIEWDFVNKHYNLDMEDEEKFTEEMLWRPDDFHRMYMPYKRLVGFQVMKTYSHLPQEKPGETKRHLGELLKSDLFDESEERAEIQPVYRPLTAPESPSDIKYDNINLDNMDMARAQLTGADLTGTSAKNTKLLLADVASVKVAQTNMKGADLSFSTVDSALSPQRVQGVVAKHVVVVTSPQLNGYQETSLDDSLPDQETRKAETNASGEVTEVKVIPMCIISDSQGKVLPVNQIIEDRQACIKREEQEHLQRDEADSLSSGLPSPASLNSPTLSSPDSGRVLAISQEQLKAEKKRRRRARRKPQEPNPILDVSSSSVPSSTDFNILDDRRSRNPPLRRSPAAVEESPQPHERSLSSSSVTFSDNVPIPHQNGNASFEEEVIRPGSAASQHSGVIIRGSSRSPSAPRSLSSSNIHSEAYHPLSGHDTSLPPLRGTRITSTIPRMVKSVSHHGGSFKTASIDSRESYGFIPLGRRQLSTAEIEYLRRSQIFNMMKGLQITNLEDNLPDIGPSFLGRDQEVGDVTELLSSSGRIINMCGCSGAGKSSLAIAVALEMKKRLVVPLYVDCRGCNTTESVWRNMMHTLELKMKMQDIQYFYNWINCREQRLLFVFDNLELPPTEDDKLSELLDNLMMNVKNIRMLCTSRRNFFRGQATQELYRVGDIRAESDAILTSLVPDLHEEGIHQLALAADHVLLGLIICGKSFAIEDVDSGKLFEDLTSPEPNGLPLGKLEDVLAEMTEDVMEKQKLTRMASCVRTILDYFQVEVRQLLTKLSCTSSFSVKGAAKLAAMDQTQAEGVLNELVNCHMLLAVTKQEGRFYIPKVVKLVLDTCWPDDGTNSHNYVTYFVNSLKQVCTQYHSKDCHEALAVVDAEYDNIVDALNRVLEREDAFDLCSDFASPEYAMFLYEILPRDLYEDLYDSLVQQCEEQGDWLTQVYALCCSAYMHTAEKEYDAGKICAERAYAILQSKGTAVKEKDRAYCLLCLGKIYYLHSDDKEKGVMLVKRALDTFKTSFGLRHLRTLYANEQYGLMLTQKGSFQTARHFYNISDFIVRELLDVHPQLLEGYNCRRAIWDKLCLFQRATDVAQKAADTAKLYLGQHPTTATVLAQLCDAIMRRGSLNDAMQTAVAALSIRIKVLGDHEDTGVSYKTVAHLMMRSSQYDEAVRFGQSALDIYEKVGASDRLIIEVKNLMAQSKFRLDCKSTRFVELESKDASKKNIADDHNSSIVSSISTEV